MPSIAYATLELQSVELVFVGGLPYLFFGDSFWHVAGHHIIYIAFNFLGVPDINLCEQMEGQRVTRRVVHDTKVFVQHSVHNSLNPDVLWFVEYTFQRL